MAKKINRTNTDWEKTTFYVPRASPVID